MAKNNYSLISSLQLAKICGVSDFIEAAERTGSAKMKEVAATLTEESNPVLIICELK